jgi:hypothetical protein
MLGIRVSLLTICAMMPTARTIAKTAKMWIGSMIRPFTLLSLVLGGNDIK